MPSTYYAYTWDTESNCQKNTQLNFTLAEECPINGVLCNTSSGEDDQCPLPVLHKTTAPHSKVRLCNLSKPLLNIPMRTTHVLFVIKHQSYYLPHCSCLSTTSQGETSWFWCPASLFPVKLLPLPFGKNYTLSHCLLLLWVSWNPQSKASRTHNNSLSSPFLVFHFL